MHGWTPTHRHTGDVGGEGRLTGVAVDDGDERVAGGDGIGGGEI